MKKIIYTFALILLIGTIFFSYKVISGKYDKQNSFILKIKEIVPIKLKNNLKNYIYNFRAILVKDELQKLQKVFNSFEYVGKNIF